MTDLAHVSLFAGVGGADLGMEAAEVPTVLACEIDKHARAVLAHRFPRATLHDDVRTLTGDHLRRAGAVPERTILSGGFPCQPFSVAGRRRGMGGDDERGTPRECERLMGWPDDHTRYRIGPDGEPVEQADSHRYKQCGNGMAAPVVEWIARRIVEADR